MKNAYGESWEMPEWMVNMAGELEVPGGVTRQMNGKDIVEDSKEAILNEVAHRMNNCYGSTLEILTGKHIDEDAKVPTPEPYLKIYPSLPMEVPSRVAKVMAKCLHVPGFERRGFQFNLMNNFSYNMTQRVNAYFDATREEELLRPAVRIVNWPSIKAKTYGEKWKDFDETIERLGIKAEFLATVDPTYLNSDESFKGVRESLLEKYGWCGASTHGESNRVALPAFVDMACRGWVISTLSA